MAASHGQIRNKSQHRGKRFVKRQTAKKERRVARRDPENAPLRHRFAGYADGYCGY